MARLAPALLISLSFIAGAAAAQDRGPTATLPIHVQVRNPSKAQEYYQRGLAEVKSGQDSAAVADFEKSIELDPDRLETRSALDTILFKQGKWSISVQYWTEYILLHPNDGHGFCQRGAAYSWLHDEAEMRADVEKACSLGDQECCKIVHAHETSSRPVVPPARSGGKQIPLSVWIILALMGAVWGIFGFVDISGVKPATHLGQTMGWAMPSELKGSPPRSVSLDLDKARTLFGDVSFMLAPFAVAMLAVPLFHFPSTAMVEFFLMGVYMVLAASLPKFIFMKRAKDLLTYGVPTRGVVINWVRGSRGWNYWVRYEFGFPETSRSGTFGALQPDAEVGAEANGPMEDQRGKSLLQLYPSLFLGNVPGPSRVLTVLVDPADFDRSVLYDLCPFKVD